MGKKPTYEFVKKSFEDEGYTLLSKEYKNNTTKLTYICPEGHKHSIGWGKWRQGNRCFYCFGTVKLTYDFVKDFFNINGYTLLSKEYSNARNKLHYICSNGHVWSTNWDNFYNKNKRCPYCAGQGRPSVDEIKSSFEKESYTLAEVDYINAHTKINYTCPVGHKHSMSWNNWGTGYRCPECAVIKMSGPGHPNWQGGKSFEPYCEAWKCKEYKQDIRDRDGNKCLNPYCDSPDANDLTIHHIDYDKKNCHPKNLITVCRSCNAKANSDREWHKSWYQTIIKHRYGYK